MVEQCGKLNVSVQFRKYILTFLWAISIRGSAPALQAGGCDFEHHMCPPFVWVAQLVVAAD